MSEEEKEEYETAIANGKDIIKVFEFPEGSIAYYEIYSMINLIEKQQKEIEKYKKQIDLEWVENNYIEKSKYNQLLKVIDKLLEEEAVNVMYYDTEEDRQEYIKQLKEKLYKEVENE